MLVEGQLAEVAAGQSEALPVPGEGGAQLRAAGRRHGFTHLHDVPVPGLHLDDHLERLRGPAAPAAEMRPVARHARGRAVPPGGPFRDQPLLRAGGQPRQTLHAQRVVLVEALQHIGQLAGGQRLVQRGCLPGRQGRRRQGPARTERLDVTVQEACVQRRTRRRQAGEGRPAARRVNPRTAPPGVDFRKRQPLRRDRPQEETSQQVQGMVRSHRLLPQPLQPVTVGHQADGVAEQVERQHHLAPAARTRRAQVEDTPVLPADMG